MLKKISIFFVFTVFLFVSCTQNNTVKELKEWALIDSLYKKIVEPKVEKMELNESLRLVDSLYAAEPNRDIIFKQFYYNSHTWMNNRMGNYQLAISYADSLLNILRQIYTEEEIPKEYLGIFDQKGHAYYSLNNYENAYENYFKANLLYKKKLSDCDKIFSLNNLALVLYKQQQYAEAKDNFIKSSVFTKLCSEKGEQFLINQEQETLDNIALCYTKLNQPDSAVYYYDSALSIIEKYKYTSAGDTLTSLKRYASYKGVVFGNLAKIFVSKKQLDSATKLYKEAIYLNSKIGFEKSDAQLCQEQLARVQWKKNDFAGMKQSLDELRQGLDTLPNTEAELGWRELMAAYYENINDAAQEIKYYRGFIALQDSISFAKKGSFENSITRELRDKEQQFQITVLQKDNQLSKLYLWIITALSVMAVIIAFLVYKNYRKGKKNITTLTNLNNQIFQQQKKTEYALQQLEVSNKDKDKILRVVAHDLRNPISGIATISQTILENEEEYSNKNLIKLIEKTSTNSLVLINNLLQENNREDE